MAEIILYLGESAVGKTTSLRNLNPEKTVVITPNSKSMPFKGGDKMYQSGVNRINTNRLTDVFGVLEYISTSKPEVTMVVIDDFFHFISARIFDPTFLGRTKGNDAFAKWNELGADVFNTMFAKAQDLRQDLYIVVMAHTAVKDDGTVSIKTAGKLMDNTIDIPSYFSYIFHGIIREDDTGIHYLMQTNRNSIYHAKTPMGAFKDLYIDNDMAVVIDAINEYRFVVNIP